jgi:hypothetical protein
MKNFLTKIVLVFLLTVFLICCKEKAYTFEKPYVKLEKELKNEYLGLFFQNHKIGYFQGSAHEGTSNNKKVYYLSGYAVIRLEVEKQNVNTIISEEIILDAKTEKLLYFAYKQKIGDSLLELRGYGTKDSVYLRTVSAGNVSEATLDSDYIPLASAGFLVWKEGIQEGKKRTFKVYVEALQKPEILNVEIGKKRIVEGKNVFPMKQRLGNIEITTEILENGDIFKEESIQGFTLKKLSKEEALKLDGSLSFYELFSYSLIPVDKAPPKNAETLKIELKGIENVIIPEGNFQVVEKKGSSLIVTVSSGKPLNTKKEHNLEKYLKATPKIQKDAKEIKKLALEITKGMSKDKEKAEAILMWVNKNIKKRLSDKFSALEVLRDREGECEAHSMLTSALLRSIGIPSRVVGGIVYSYENGGFLYHAWNEVYIDGYFVPVDATYGQFPADVTHIKLTSEDNMEDVALYLGRLKVNILE